MYPSSTASTYGRIQHLGGSYHISLGPIFTNTITPTATRDTHLGTSCAAGIPYYGDC
jgi:hypothetical protein